MDFLNFVSKAKEINAKAVPPVSEKKPLRLMFVDALIVAGMVAFSAFAVGDIELAWKEAFVTGGLAFFTQFALERGIKRT